MISFRELTGIQRGILVVYISPTLPLRRLVICPIPGLTYTDITHIPTAKGVRYSSRNRTASVLDSDCGPPPVQVSNPVRKANVGQENGVELHHTVLILPRINPSCLHQTEEDLLV